MIKMLLRFAVLAALAFAFTWMANQPGTMSMTWLGYQIDEIPVYLVMLLFFVLFFVVWFAWWVIRLVFCTPGAVGDFFRMRRHRKGIDALSKGMVAVSAGDATTARKQALQAKKLVADSPLAHLLEAQAAQLTGDNSRVAQIYNTMLDDPETELVALRGLYVAARKQGDEAAARDYAERANRRDGSLAWASNAVATYLSGDKDWPAVATLIDGQRRRGVIDRDEADAKRAVVLTAQAMAVEDSDPAAAADLAGKAHRLDPTLVPAAVVAGRALAGQGSLRKAAKILEKTWRLSPHPDIAETYVHARMGDSAQDRLRRVKELLRVSDGGLEGAIAQANVAIDARDWVQARKALDGHLDQPSVRVCMLMAEIEEGEFGDSGKSREWLSRAVRAPRDPAWTADGVVSANWLPVSPASGELGAFAWRVPLTALDAPSDAAEPEVLEDDVTLPGDDAIVVGEASTTSEAVAAADEEEVIEVADDAEAEQPAAEDVQAGAAPDDAEEGEAIDSSGSQAPEIAEDDAKEAAADDGEQVAGEVEEAAVELEDVASGDEEVAADAKAEADTAAPATADEPETGELLPDNRQPDDPGPRTDRPANGSRSWFG